MLKWSKSSTETRYYSARAECTKVHKSVDMCAQSSISVFCGKFIKTIDFGRNRGGIPCFINPYKVPYFGLFLRNSRNFVLEEFS